MSGFSRESIENQLLKMIQSQRFKTLYDKAVYLRTGKQSENRIPELQYPISDTIQAALWLLDEMGLSDIERLYQHQDLYEANLKKG